MSVDYLTPLKRWIADLLWPPRCAACGRLGTVACTFCIRTLVPSRPRCPGCQRPGRAGLPCPACRGRTHLDRLVTAFSLDSPAEAFVYALKYRNVQMLTAPLMDRCCDLVSLRPDTASLFGTNPLIVPVPLHDSRLRERGYNQAELIARRMSATVAMDMRSDVLIRTRPTGQQAKAASRSERRDNMVGAFSVTDPAAVASRDIVLVDDVVTTGATLNDCARALKEAGAQTVSAITLAHG